MFSGVGKTRGDAVRFILARGPWGIFSRNVCMPGRTKMYSRAAVGAFGRIQTVKRLAKGHWRGLFASFGIDAASLSSPNQTCPICGSAGRFSLINTRSDGTYVCRCCGRGDGIDLIARATGLGFTRTVGELERRLSGVRARQGLRRLCAAHTALDRLTLRFRGAPYCACVRSYLWELLEI